MEERGGGQWEAGEGRRAVGPDEAAELMRHLLREALILGAPVLLAACVTSFAISLVQTLTSLQDQTISTVPRLLVVVGLLMAGLPWFLGRLMSYTLGLFSDFHRFLGKG
jgi:flagellar biosynthetic protein FliQ